MENSNDRITFLKEDMERIRKEKPHVGTLLDAFSPLIMNEILLTEQVATKSISLAPDKLKTLGGIPLIKEHALFSPDDPWQDLALSTAAAIQEGFPTLAEEMNRLTARLRQNPEVLNDLFLEYGTTDENKISAWAEEMQVQPAALSLLIDSVRRIILTGRANNLAEEIADLTWNKGYCPVCGNFPMLAFLRVNGQRWLHCSSCHHEWTYPRPQCPWCEHETPDNTTYLFVDDEKENSAYICEKCQKYLITVNRAESLRDMDPDLTAISLAHLDVILQEKGYSPMATCGWNTF
jgi:FdhE protein